MDIARSKKCKYNMRNAAASKKGTADALIEYQSSSFVERAISNQLFKENPSTSTLSDSSIESPNYEVEQCEENDNIFTEENEDNSIGTRIKEAAVKVHDKYQRDEALTSEEVNVMSLGLSSILDLSNNSKRSQKSLFTETEWSILAD
jgi:hypothetical protein